MRRNEENKPLYFITSIMNITERKRVEEALRRSEERMRAIVEGTPHLFFYTQDAEANTTYVSPTIEQITGYKIDIWLKRKDWFVTDAEVSQLAKERTRAHLQGWFDEEPMLIEVRHANGEPILLEAYEYPIVQNGKVIGLQGVAHDITERKRSEEALRESEMKYRDMVEQINDVIFATDANGIFTYISPTVEILGGYKPEEMIGHSIGEFLDPLFLPKIKEQFQKVMMGIGVATEYRVRIKSGEFRWARSSSKPILNENRPIGVRGVLTDITAQKQAEEMVSLLSHTVKSIAECVSLTDLNNRILFVNQAFLNLYGYSSEELIGKSMGVVTPEGIDNQEVVRATSVGGWQGELINRKKDGTEFPVYLSTSVVLNDSGIPIALVGVATDITEQKKLQHELLQAQKIQSIGTLAGGIAHDFNNILGIIVGYSSLLEQGGDDKKKMIRYSAAITKAADRGAALVRQILTFARRTDVSFQPINIPDFVAELISMLEETFPKVIEIEKMIEGTIPVVVADHTQMHQALLNLCVNARDAMPSGGSLVLKVSTVDNTIVRKYFNAANAERYVCIAVSDTGMGMDEKTRDRIFDPFFTTKEAGKGTGLGLSVVYGVMQTHHGFVYAESEKGKGSTFFLYLPVPSEAESEHDQVDISGSEVSGGTETILIVEDEDMLRSMLQERLESKGYRVYAAADGLEAVSFYSSHRTQIDLVLTDVGLPKMTGIEEFNKLKEINPNVKVLLASGFFEPHTKSKLYKAGAKGFIQKPYIPEATLRKIREVLDMP